MIKEMRLVNITGPRDEIEYLSTEYLSRYEIHLVNALQELSQIKSLRPYTSTNPYQVWEDELNYLLSLADAKDRPAPSKNQNFNFQEVKDLVNEQSAFLTANNQVYEQYQKDYQEIKHLYQLFSPFAEIDYEFNKVLEMKYLRYRFGYFDKDDYDKYVKYLDSSVPAIFVKAKEVDERVYGIYFTPLESRQRVDALFLSLAWNRIRLPEVEAFQGMSFQAINQQLKGQLKAAKQNLADSQKRIQELINPLVPSLLDARQTIEDLSQAFEIRRYAAITRDEMVQKESRYLLLGWMDSQEARQLEADLEIETSIVIYSEDADDITDMQTPTKMKNNFFARPFEIFTRMYGVPNYHEMDPTPLLAFTYSLFFGAMFGDIGQGFCLFLLGLILGRRPGMEGMKILRSMGLSSMIFGFLFGTFFGFEEIFPALWLYPGEHMTDIPFFGQLNTVFIVSVAFGMFMIIVTMVINIWQRLKQGDTLEAIFDRNGIFGLIFYGTLVFLLVLYFTGYPFAATTALIAILVVSFLIVALKEPIINKLTKASEENPDSLVITALSLFFEAFETMITYMSNTISFLRVGAFAVSHGAMMSVVLMFGNVVNGQIGPETNWIALILGNLFITAFEGLIVGIQVLRLEFYELFSHFYSGDGIEFKNFWSNSN